MCVIVYFIAPNLYHFTTVVKLFAEGVVLKALCVLLFCFIVVNVSDGDRVVIETCYEI
jgi:hypothetical protein